MVKKYISISFIVCLCLCTFTVASVRADDDNLKIGDALPTSTDVFLQIETGHVKPTVQTTCVLLVFFETGYDKKSTMITALNALQKNLGAKGLQVIAVCKDDIKKNKEFTKAELASMVITLATAVDADEGWRKWVEDSKMEIMPLAFICSQSKILGIGSPLDDSLSSVLRKAVVGKYDPQLIKKAQPMLDAARKSLQVRNMQEAYKHFDEVIELDPAFFVDIVLERYKVSLKNESDPKVVSEWIQLTAKKCGSVTAQSEIVGAIVNDPEIQKRDLESALIIADSMISKSATLGLQSKAMIYAAKKDWTQAIDVQTDAWMGASIADKPMAKQRLEEYREASKRAPVKSK